MNFPIMLDEDTEKLVIDLAAEYSERVVAGEAPSLKPYLDRLPNEAARRNFRQAASMTTFIADAQNISIASEGREHAIAPGKAPLQIPEHI